MDYVQLNQGIKPKTVHSPSSQSQSYSAVTKNHEERNETENSSTDEVTEKRRNRGKEFKETENRNRRPGDAFEFIKSLSHKLNLAQTDSDQDKQTSLSNDLMLIDIGRMVMEFMLNAERKVVYYSEREEENLSDEDF